MDKTKLVITLSIIVIAVVGVWFAFQLSGFLSGTQAPQDEPLLVEEEEEISESDLSESPGLLETVWTVFRLAGQPPSEGSALTLQFSADGRLSGHDGCNSFSTSFTQVGNQELVINPAMVSTLMACPPEAMKEATDFTSRLLATTSYVLDDGVLTLRQADEAGLVLSGESNPIAKTAWQVTGFNNGREAVVSPLLKTELTLTFGEDGTLHGSGGCNNFTGQYTLDRAAMTIGPVGATMMACAEPEGIMEQEAQFLAALETVNSWSLNGSTLFLRTAEDTMAITATALR